MPAFDYRSSHPTHVTTVTRLRQPFFRNDHLARICVDAIEETRLKFNAVVSAYCVMPDHVHLLAEMPEGVSLEAFMKHFKQLSGFRLKAQTGKPAWQVSYYDHVLRREEAVRDVARYIWSNPVRAGLIDDARDYPYSGPRERMG
jgi:REP element-mobilizing transposase RayT